MQIEDNEYRRRFNEVRREFDQVYAQCLRLHSQEDVAEAVTGERDRLWEQWLPLALKIDGMVREACGRR